MSLPFVLLAISAFFVDRAIGNRGEVSNGNHFNTCNYQQCKKWCKAIPCCVSGEWQDQKCWLYNSLAHGPRTPECSKTGGAPCSFRVSTRIGEKDAEARPHPLLQKWRRKNLTLCFHMNQLNERGTERATFDYAYFAKHMLGHDIKLLLAKERLDRPASEGIKRRFAAEFGGFTAYEVDGAWRARYGPLGGPAMVDAVHALKCHNVYGLKGGTPDGEPKVPESLIRVPFSPHAVFMYGGVHGTSYAAVGRKVAEGECPQGPTVHHMVYPHERQNASEPYEDLRKRFGVKETDHLVCRHGATDTFDIDYVRASIPGILDQFPTLHILLMNTNGLAQSHPRLHYLDARVDDKGRLEYFEACDAMLHGRSGGETFGLAVAEMSVHNRPVITSTAGTQEHVHILGSKGFVYSDASSLRNRIRDIVSIPRKALLARDWNAYQLYLPRPIMEAFDDIFIQPALVYWAMLEQRGISNPWNVSLDQLPPRYNYFLRCHIDGYMGRVLPTADTMLRWLPRLCPPASRPQ
eukprot:EG_transcript_8307